MRIRNWARYVGLGVLSTLIAGCQPDPNSPPILRDGQEFQTALKRVRELTKGPFEAMHEGFPISEREKKDLREASHLIDGMIAFNTATYAPYILRGLTKRALGDQEGAMAAYQQGLAFAPPDPKGDDAGAIGRVYDEIGTLLFEQHKYTEGEDYADKAAELLPDDPSILTNTASTKVELQKTAEARKLIETALKRDPHYGRALSLKKLLDMAAKDH